MRRALVLLAILLSFAAPVRADEDARKLRIELQHLWYGGNPKLIEAGMSEAKLKPLLDDAEELCRFLVFLNDVTPRLDPGGTVDAAWKRIEASIAKLGASADNTSRGVWAQEEAKQFPVYLRRQAGAPDEEDWKLMHKTVEEISRTEGTGLWTTHGYFRAFEHHARGMWAEGMNFYTAAGGFIYLTAKMEFIPRRFSRHAIPVAQAHKPYVTGVIALRGKKPDYAKARPKLEEALRTIGGYLTDDSVPLPALHLHNDIVRIIERFPGLEMEVAYKTRPLERLRETLHPRIEAIDTTLVLAPPLTRDWRLFEGRVGEREALHLLRTTPGGLPAYEFTVTTFPLNEKCPVPGAKKPLKGSKLKLVAAALAKTVGAALGAEAKVRAPKKAAFHGKLESGYRYEVTRNDRRVEGYVGRGARFAYAIEMLRHAPLDQPLPGDVALFLENLALAK